MTSASNVSRYGPSAGSLGASAGFVITRYRYLAGYMLAMNLLAFTNMFLPGRTLSSLLLMPLALGSMVITAVFLKKVAEQQRPTLPYLDLCILAYIIYSLLSVFLFLQPSNPASMRAYLYGVNLQVLPMFVYFAAKGLDDVDAARVLKFMVALHVAVAAIGVFLFFARPDFYTLHVSDKLAVTEEWQVYGRLQSFWGSTAVGILSAVSIVLLTNVGWSRVARYAFLVLFLVTIFFAQQRGAYASGVLATAYFLYRERLGLAYVLVVLSGLVIGLIAVLSYYQVSADLLFTIINNRIVDGLLYENPLAERAGSYDKGMAFLADFPLGLGLGATTSAADDAGAHLGGQVVDANYMRIAADLGVVGLFLFLMLLVVAFLTAFRASRVNGLALIVVMYGIQASGTNVLDAYYVSHVLWILLGLMTSDRAGQRTERLSPVPT